MSHPFADDARRIAWLKTAVCLGLAGGVLTTGSLWLSERFLPMTPALGWFPPTPFPVDALLLAALVFLLGWVAIAKRPAAAIAAALALLALLLLQDQGRLYPSVYEYVFLLAVLASYGYARPPDASASLAVARLLIACVYVWSGIQKLDPGFSQVIFPRLVGPALGPAMASQAVAMLVYLASRLAPWLEIAAGVGLLSARYRSKALFLALAMHLFSFFAIGPWGFWQAAAWEWNLVTAVMAIILFFRLEKVGWKAIVLPKNALHAAVALLFGLMPLLNFFSLWDSALSFNIFSGNVTNGPIILSDAMAARLPEEVRAYVERDARGRNILQPDTLSHAEFGAGLYAEPRIFRNIEKKFCGFAEKPDDAVMILSARRDWFGTPPPVTLDCSSE